jgi:hypothetical protein
VTLVPSINSLIEIVVNDEHAYRSRVEAKVDGALTVAAPIGAGDLEPPEVGTILTVGWTVARLRYVVSVRLTNISRQRPPRWVVEVVGEVRQENRRNFVRGGGGGTVRLSDIGAGNRVGPVVGKIIDLSEGGLRCHLAVFDHQPGDPIHVQLALGGEAVEVDGLIQSLRPPTEGGGLDVVVTFGLDEPSAQRVRRYLYHLELQERRRLRDAD